MRKVISTDAFVMLQSEQNAQVKRSWTCAILDYIAEILTKDEIWQ